MRLLFITLIWIISASISAQENVSIDPYNQLKLPLRMGITGMGRSDIDWEKLEPNEWLNYNRWRAVLEARERPNDYGLSDPFRKKFREPVGKVIHCVGNCRLYRGLKNNTVEYRSPIREGDDLITKEHSYLWVFLLDGTLIRISPNSSISFREFNIGKNENFMHARINQGNILWLTRSKNKFHQLKMKRETDSLFVPLSEIYETGFEKEAMKIDENNLLAMLDEFDYVKSQYSRLNTKIEENNKWFRKPTYSYIVLQNGTVFGKNLNMEFMTFNGKKSYLKSRKYSQLGLEGKTPDDFLEFYFRGFENKNKQKLEKGVWYEIDEKGRSIETMADQDRFSLSEYITKNIPTIYVAREFLLNKYARFTHEEISAQKLAQNYGYYMWESIDKKDSNINRRIAFLHEYTRRIETTQMLVTRQIRKKVINHDDKTIYNYFGPHFYSKAIKDLMIERDRVYDSQSRDDSLNSTKRPLWKRMHGIY